MRKDYELYFDKMMLIFLWSVQNGASESLVLEGHARVVNCASEIVEGTQIVS